ncbi:hypothetical protein APHCR_1420 [Anaplasma phagocytophilum str. CR1007]|nr:hypothetical protein APHCR_1420 [Anaplasma phagocytophilum str. CR1007]
MYGGCCYLQYLAGIMLNLNVAHAKLRVGCCSGLLNFKGVCYG